MEKRRCLERRFFGAKNALCDNDMEGTRTPFFAQLACLEKTLL